MYRGTQVFDRIVELLKSIELAIEGFALRILRSIIIKTICDLFLELLDLISKLRLACASLSTFRLLV